MIPPRWHKVIRDLLNNKTKTVLVVLAITVGLFAFGSVFITQDVMVADMDSQYLATNTSGIIFTVPPFDTNLERWLRQQPDVRDVQGQATNMIKMYSGDKTYNLTLVAYEDPSNIRINRITPEKGVWPPGRREIVFERTSFPLADKAIGEKMLVELSSGKQYELTISGTAHDLNAFPGTMVPLPTGYVTWQTLEWMGFSGLPTELNIVTSPNISSVPDLEKVASTLRKKMQDRGVPVYGTRLRNPTEHWATPVMRSFSLILIGLGFFSLVLSAFLVINTITALITQQKRQIGMMKAVGGTGGQIISLYMVLVGFYGLLALILALPVSLALGYLFMSMVANLLNVDITNFHLPLRVLVLEIGASLLLPAIAAAIPVMGGVRVPVREALSDYGIGGRNETGWFDRILLKIRFFSRPLLLSLRNTFRRKARLALTLGTLTLAGTLFVGVMNIRTSMDAEFTATFKKYYDWEIAMGLDGNYPVRGVQSRVLNIPGVSGIESQTITRVNRVNADGTLGYGFMITGLSPASTVVSPDISSGRWLQNGDRNVLVLTSALLEDIPDVKVGDRLAIKIGGQKENWTVAGIIPQKWEKAAYADFDYLSRIMGTTGMTSSIFIRTDPKDGDFQAAMAQTIETQLKKAGIKIGSSITRETIVSANASQVNFLIYFLLIMAVMAAAIGALGLMGMMSLNVLERTREIGVIRSIGATNTAVAGIVIAEGLFIGGVSWAIALPLSVPMSIIFNSLLGNILFGGGLAFVLEPRGLVIWFVIVMLMALLASLLPAYRAMRMSVRETLAYE